MRRFHRSVTLVLCLLLVAAAGAQGPRTAAPESVGMSADRLARIRPTLQAFVDGKEVASLETLVARRGAVVHQAHIGVEADAIYRLASMTKPVTSVAIMMLAEDGKLLLSDPVSRFIPSFKELRVLVSPETPPTNGGDDETVPARRPITIEDLLTHRSGLIYDGFDKSRVAAYYKRAGVYPGIGPNPPASLAANVDVLAKQPLKFHPGSAYNYGLSTDVLGRVVEVVSGASLEEFFRTRIFEPLGMRDTSFNLSAGKAPRLAPLFTIENSVLQRAKGEWTPVGATYFSGGAALVGTTADYFRFAQMLVNGGELDGKRLLGRKSVELMMASHTADLGPGAVRPGFGFGYGGDVRESLGGSHRAGSEGAFGWSGVYGTYFWVDRTEQLVGLLMHQLYPRNGRAAEVFQTLTYAAIID